MSKAAELAKMGEVLTNSQIGGRRNIIINGAMQLAQRTTSSASILASTAVIPACDRWMFEVSGSNTSGRLTVSQSTDTPNGFGNSLKLDVTTADTSIAADEFVSLVQRIEGQNLQQLKKGTSDAETSTLSFFAKGTAKKYSCGFYDVDNSRNVHAHFDVTTSWQRFIINFPADTTGAFDNDNAQSAFILFNLHAGTNFSSGTLNTTWQANDNTDRAAGIDSLLSSTDNELYITGVQLEVGSTATPFEHRSFGEEELLCQRYYYQSADDVTAGVSQGSMWCGENINTTECFGSGMNFPVTMRATPTVTIFDNAGNSGAAHMLGTGDVSGVSVANIHRQGFSKLSKSSGLTDERQLGAQYTADAEL
jgi:hypothetical protein